MEEIITDYKNVSFEEVQRCWIVRGHDNNDGFGSHYDWSFVLVKDGNKGIAKGMISDNMLTTPDIEAIRDFIRRHGMECVEYTRVRPSGKTTHRIR